MQAGLSLKCWLQIPYCWKSHVVAQINKQYTQISLIWVLGVWFDYLHKAKSEHLSNSEYPEQTD